MGTTLLIIGGIYNLAFAVFHILFWKIFRWKADLRSLTRTNRCIMQILNLRLIYVFIVFAVASLCFPESLLSTGLGKFVLFSISLFWLVRAIEQVIFFGFRNWVSFALFVVFAIGGILYLVPAIVV
jgi:hypothetical protein